MVTDENKISATQTAALDLRSQGYNCSQCIMMSCGSFTGLSNDKLAKFGIALGGGFGGTGNQCGVLTALGILTGCNLWSTTADKANVYRKIRELKQMFESRYGTVVCRELKAKGVSCQRLIIEGIDYFMRTE